MYKTTGWQLTCDAHPEEGALGITKVSFGNAAFDVAAEGFPLKTKQVDALVLRAIGLTTLEVGYQLGVSERAAKHYTKSVFDTLESEHGCHAVTEAFMRGLFQVRKPLRQFGVFSPEESTLVSALATGKSRELIALETGRRAADIKLQTDKLRGRFGSQPNVISLVTASHLAEFTLHSTAEAIVKKWTAVVEHAQQQPIRNIGMADGQFTAIIGYMSGEVTLAAALEACGRDVR